MRLGTNSTRRHVDEHAPAVTWLECCRYSLNPKQSINHEHVQCSTLFSVSIAATYHDLCCLLWGRKSGDHTYLRWKGPLIFIFIRFK